MHELIDKQKSYAVVGASRDPMKYGHRVFKDLFGGGFQVVPVNPNVDKLLGEMVYRNLSSIPERPEVVVFVVPPTVTEEILREVVDLDIKNVWFQPGSESKAAIQFCQENSLNFVYDKCIMVERKKDEQK